MTIPDCDDQPDEVRHVHAPENGTLNATGTVWWVRSTVSTPCCTLSMLETPPGHRTLISYVHRRGQRGSKSGVMAVALPIYDAKESIT